MPEGNLGGDECENGNSRRSTDKVILQQIFSMNKTLTQISNDMAEFKGVKACVDKHEKVIYGDPEKMGEGGLIFTVNNLKKTASIVASAVSTGVSAAFTIALTFLAGKK